MAIVETATVEVTGKGISWLWSNLVKPFLTKNKKKQDDIYLMVKEIKGELKFNGGSSIKDAVWQIKEGMVEFNNRLAGIEQNQHVALNLQGLAFWISNTEGKCVYASSNLCKLMGHSESDIMGSNWVAWIIPQDRERIYESWNFSIENKSPFDEQYTFKRADGHYQKVWGLAFHKKINGEHHGTMGKLEPIGDSFIKP